MFQWADPVLHILKSAELSFSIQYDMASSPAIYSYMLHYVQLVYKALQLGIPVMIYLLKKEILNMLCAFRSKYAYIKL